MMYNSEPVLCDIVECWWRAMYCVLLVYAPFSPVVGKQKQKFFFWTSTTHQLIQLKLLSLQCPWVYPSSAFEQAVSNHAVAYKDCPSSIQNVRQLASFRTCNRLKWQNIKKSKVISRNTQVSDKLCDQKSFAKNIYQQPLITQQCYSTTSFRAKLEQLYIWTVSSTERHSWIEYCL